MEASKFHPNERIYRMGVIFQKETKQCKRKKKKGLDKLGLKCYSVKAVTERGLRENGSEKEKQKVLDKRLRV